MDFILWYMATYIVFRLYGMQMVELDFRFWDNDLTAVAAIGYTMLSFRIYTLLIK